MRGLSFAKSYLALNLLCNACEHLRLLSCKRSKYLAVEFDVRLCLCSDERAVGLEAEVTDGSVQAYDPKLAEVRLLVTTMIEGVLSCVDERLLRELYLRGAAMAISLGANQYVSAALSRCDSSFYSCHTELITKLLFGDCTQEAATNMIADLDDVRATLHTLSASAFLRVEMVLAWLACDKFPGAGHLDALRV